MNDRAISDPFNTEWAPDEPMNTPGSDCAYVSKLAGFKVLTDSCLASKPFFCMALAPNCPEDFEHIPQYKDGLSCLKNLELSEVTHPTTSEFSFMHANKKCQDLNTRMLHPANGNDTDFIYSLYPKPVGISYWFYGLLDYFADAPWDQHVISPTR